MRSFAQKAPQPASDTRRQPVAQGVALNPVRQLQRRIGNQALQRMQQAHGGKGKEEAGAHDAPPRIQPKLTINAPGDAHEQEADRVAQQVMRMPEPSQCNAPVGSSGDDLMQSQLAINVGPALGGVFDSTQGVNDGPARNQEGDSDPNSTTDDNPPTLGMTAVAGPSKTDCGGMDWRIDWTLDKPAPKGGAIVQEVVHDATFFNCGPGGVRYPDRYWEMWTVKKGKTRPVELNADYDDVFNFSPSNLAKRGTFTMSGVADFYPGQSPGGFKVDLKSPAKFLPMTRTDPKLTGGTGPVSRSMTAEWNCCEDSADRTTKLTVK